MSIRYVTTGEAHAVIRSVLGLEPQAVLRDAVLLESALGRPAATMFGRDAYPDIHTKAAALLHSVLRNHALIDGNKRTGWMLCALFYALNGYEERYDEQGMFALVIAVADGSVQDVAEIGRRLAGWFAPRE